jgi:hypothetical protein
MTHFLGFMIMPWVVPLVLLVVPLVMLLVVPLNWMCLAPLDPLVMLLVVPLKFFVYFIWYIVCLPYVVPVCFNFKKGFGKKINLWTL